MKEDYGTQLESGAVRFERDLPGPIERVWDYIVDPGKRATWFCGGTTGGKPGDPFVLEFDHDRISDDPLPERYAEMAGGVTMGARVVEIDPPRLFVFSWDGEDEQTRIELEPRGDRVRLVLLQSPPAELKERVSMAAGWHAHLGLLIDRLEGVAPRRFWAEHETVEQHYLQSVS